MEIPLNAPVRCSDGQAGRSTCLVIHPANQTVTHLVVTVDGGQDHLVPIDRIASASPEGITLSCSRAELAAMEPFTETEFVQTELPHLEMHAEGAYMWPYVSPATHVTAQAHERIPPGELAVRRGAEVLASDGAIGKVSELMIDPEDGHVTHLVLREGHLWGKRDVVVPLALVDGLREGAVHLRASKAEVGELPHIAVKRWWA